ncbi:MAG: hypothetical protein JNK23_21250 [Opitutaceae bacterium]|nr:hypothetical protein [Opitutaceae bacterium]
MKVIFSRKGWDSGFGGRPSPVFPDGSIQSLPIHDCSDREAPHSKITPHVLKKQGYPTLDKFLEVYHREGVPERHAHLDPDLDLEAFQRKEGWLPSFGQSGGPATHLDRCHVSVGDLFFSTAGSTMSS